LLCRLKINDLKIDHTYQRLEASPHNTAVMARNFNWTAFGTVVVMERANGEKYLVDGQQRVLAAIRRGNIKEVPCILFHSDGIDHEAKAFISLNVSRKPVNAADKFRARVLAYIEPELQINKWLVQNGFEVTSGGKSLKGIDFPTKLVWLWEKDAEASKEAILVQRLINGPEPLISSIHLGLWYLKHKGIDIRSWVDKLACSGGRSALARSIRTAEIETDSHNTYKISAAGILRLINTGCRRKIKLPADSEAA